MRKCRSSRNCPATHGLVEIAVRRRDDSGVEQHLARGAERTHAPLLEHAQKLRLKIDRHVADLVEKQRSARSLFE